MNNNEILKVIKNEPHHIEFIMNIKPVAKERPRLGRYGVYTPPKTRDFESALKLIGMNIKNEALVGPLSVHLEFVYKKPKSHYAEHQYKTTRPDLDNLEKAILDGFNGVLWIDDSQVCEKSSVKKFLTSTAINEYIFVSVRSLLNNK